MNRADFYRLALQSGLDADPRVTTALSRELQESKANYDVLKHETMTVSDLETLSKSYTDSRIFHNSPAQNVNMVFAGIDIETPELLLASRLNEKEMAVDAVCAHLLCMVGSRSLFLFTTACPG